MDKKNNYKLSFSISILSILIILGCVALSKEYVTIKEETSDKDSSKSQNNDSIFAQQQNTKNEVNEDSIFENNKNDNITIYYDMENERKDNNDITSFVAIDDFKKSWEITDVKTIEQIAEWLNTFQQTHKATDKPSGYEVSSERYKFNFRNQEIKINFFDDAAIVIDDNYYLGTYLSDLEDLISLIIDKPQYIKIKSGSYGTLNSWTLDDENKIEELTTSIDNIINTCDYDISGMKKGGLLPILSYKYKETFYRVQFDPDEEYNVHIELRDENNNKLNVSYKADNDLIKQLNELISE